MGQEGHYDCELLFFLMGPPRKYKFLEQPRRSTHKNHYLGNMSEDNAGNTAGGRGQRSRG